MTPLQALHAIAAAEVDADRAGVAFDAFPVMRQMGRIARLAIAEALPGTPSHAHVPCPEPQARCLAEEFEVGHGACHQITATGLCGEGEFAPVHEQPVV